MTIHTTPAKGKTKVPAGALRFVQPDQNAFVEFSGEGEARVPKLNMIIYSGGIIKDHWYWDDLVLDLSGVSFPKKTFPILLEHWTDKKIAFHQGPAITADGNLRVDPDKVKFVSTPESEEFQRLSSEGFPYEASASVRPTVIERIAKDAFGEANGIKVKGPATIFRKWELKEGSVCVFGYDRNTQSSTFSQNEEEVELDCEISGGPSRSNRFNSKEGVKPMTMNKETLLKDHPDLVKQIQDDAIAAAKTSLSAEIDQKIQPVLAQANALKETVDAQAKTITELNAKNLNLEKQNMLRAEAELALKADNEWDAQLRKSDVPEHMHAKVKKHVSHSSFINKETGACDWTAFSAAVAAEVKDWETQLSQVGSSVAGGGFVRRSANESPEDTALAAEDDAWVKEMAALAGDVSEGGQV